MIFAPGTHVITRARAGGGHTRLPAYLQNKSGVVMSYLGEYPLPDENARDPQTARLDRLYTVEFRAADVFAELREDAHIRADLFEAYLEAVP